MRETKTHGSQELDADAAKLEAMGADQGPTLDDVFDYRALLVKYLALSEEVDPGSIDFCLIFAPHGDAKLSGDEVDVVRRLAAVALDEQK